MKFVGITKRWLISVASIVFLVLVCTSVLLCALLRTYYYGVAAKTIDSFSSSEISTFFGLYGASVRGFDSAARDYVESFPDKDSVAVWVIDNSGNIIVSTSGFKITDKVEMPDYESAKKSNAGSARWIGRLPSGEKIMASTYIYNYSDGSYAGALRYMVSLDAIDSQLIALYVMIAVAGMFLFLIILAAGLLFIRSIVKPVKDIDETAKKIAGGDLRARIDHYPYNDEIGNLCSTINEMADRLNESDQMKSDFISTVSHELRTPLTAIKGWGETILQLGDSDPSMTERGMGVIISESKRLNDMVEELLDFSRMNSGRLQLNLERVDFLAELDEVVFAFKERAIHEGVEIVYNVPASPAPGNGDASRIKQVFINIFDNALKYTEEGGKINVNAEVVNEKTLVIAIADTGAGIPEKDLPHVKEKFYKANSTVRGSGIGLAVADDIIKLHNGSLEVGSVYGKGTTVSIILPLDFPGKENNQQ